MAERVRHRARSLSPRRANRANPSLNAASSGIGVAALQIARLLGAKPVIGSSRSAAKLEKLRPYGLQAGVLADSGSAEAIAAATGGKGVDVLIDSVGGAALQQNLAALAVRGRMVSVGRLASNSGEIDLDLLALKRIRLIGVTFRTRSKEERIECVQRCVADLWQALADGRLQPVVHRSFRMGDVKAAHDYMERDEHIGKLVIEISSAIRGDDYCGLTPAFFAIFSKIPIQSS